MSRIIVKNLPLTMSDEKFRQHFADHGGIITDSKLMRTRNGQSRRFGFIGYRSSADADEAVKYFNKTFIGMAKIDVAVAEAINNAAVPKPRNEKFQVIDVVAKAGDKFDSAQPNKKRKTEDDKPLEDSKLVEYLNAMKPRVNEKTWANDDISGLPLERAPPVVEGSRLNEDPQEILQSNKILSQSVSKFDDVSDAVSADDELIGENKQEDNLATQGVSDDEWLRARRKRMAERPIEESEKQDGSVEVVNGAAAAVVFANEEEQKVEVAPEPEKTEQEINLEKIRFSKRLFIRNLSYACSEDDLRELFGSYGELEEVHIPVDTETHNSKGFAYILFTNGNEAAEAFETLDKKSFQGRLLHVLPGQPKRENKLDDFEFAKLPLKKQQALRRKAAAASSQFSWSSLYMNTDAVVSSLAQKMGVSKADLLDPESTEAGVRQAMAEAHAIDDAKKYFESVGLNLNALGDTKVAKSDTVILVKNFPFDTSVEELRNMFAEYGDVRRVLMPPSNTIAVVEFATAPHARAAFTKLAYRRFKNSIIYLEKAPSTLLKEGFSSLPVAPSAIAHQVVKEALPSMSDIIEPTEENTESGVGVGSVSLFVKNLNFKTKTSELASVFSPLDGFIRAEVKVKKDVKNNGQLLSMGFGFVEFRTKQQADLAVRTMSDFVLDGHKLQVKTSTRGSDSETTSSSKKDKASSAPKTKIIIKNLPFEATKKDIRQLFGAFGQLRTVRMPRKFDNTARGFAFAEFVTAKEAEHAMKSLAGVHLLGRRLVLQYAAEDATNAEEEIERMQSKVRKQVAGETIAQYKLSSGKRKFDLDEDEDGDA
ncbi:hypothetical protein V1514DRAFT_337647 [Lipomyces japonicus]|uniref:uncharacterized protein n=1 Tax=Lipomyces japonicus TaxID=56871 RepID=UPI0034CEF4FE